MDGKIGRNELCYCGSGKKYKKCCIELNELNTQEELSKHQFKIKGDKAEEMVYQIASKSFLIDWCYKNPKLPDGNELCDILVVFGDKVIIWQIKDVKVGKDGQYNKSDIQKNLSQLSGAKRSLFDLKVEIELDNPRRGKEKFDPTKIKEIYLISAFVGEDPYFMSFFEEFRSKKIHVFNKEAVEVILSELNTIKDFIQYIKDKEALLASEETKEGQVKRRVSLGSGEKDLLAYYLLKGRSFKELMEYDGVFLDEGHWEHLTEKPEYLKKQEEDKISYLWDKLIDTTHTCGKGYELLAKELASTSRFERRMLGKSFFDAHVRATEETKNNVYKRIVDIGRVTYCFLFVDGKKSRDFRRGYLQDTCFVARGINKDNTKVIGIATEMNMHSALSFDFVMLDIPNWGEEQQKGMNEIQKKHGILTNPEYIPFHEDEYPK